MGDREYGIGFTACYICDYIDFSHLAEIPVEAAVAWVKKACPTVVLGNHTASVDLTVGTKDDTDALGNGWLNKLFVIVGSERGNWLAIYNHDGEFSIYTGRKKGGAA